MHARFCGKIMFPVLLQHLKSIRPEHIPLPVRTSTSEAAREGIGQARSSMGRCSVKSDLGINLYHSRFSSDPDCTSICHFAVFQLKQLY